MYNIKYIGNDVHQATSIFAAMNHRRKLEAEAIIETQPQPIIDFIKGQRGTLWVTFEEGMPIGPMKFSSRNWPKSRWAT